jgi:hypothetical protein
VRPGACAIYREIEGEAMKISELLDSVAKNDLVLPEFQREYVWTKEQAKQLMVSLVKDYPVGSLLFWKTDKPPELKNLPNIPEKLGMIQVILDGQQRITTLYLLIRGEIPPYYKEVDIETDPRELYFNLEDGDFQYYQASRMRNNPVWVKVLDCFNNSDINVFLIAKNVLGKDGDSKAFDLAQRYNTNLNKVRNINSIDLTVQTVPSVAALEDSIDIFDRVNSQGTKLTDAELALTHVTGKWSQARRVLKHKIQDLEKHYFYYDLTFMTRALTGVTTRRALFEAIHKVEKDKLEAGWGNLSKIVDYLAAILPAKAFIHSTNDLNTTNVLIPVVVYLSLNQNKFPNENTLMHAIHWIYAAHIWSRYTSQTDQRLEFDVSLVAKNDNPWNDLCMQIIDQRGRIEVKGSDLEGRWIQHPLYRMTYILAKAKGALDWFNGMPLGVVTGKAYMIHYHHIFPTSKLYSAGYDPDNLMHRSSVNEIANRAFLTAETNIELSNRLPEDYLPEVEEKYPGALTRQFIPLDRTLWKINHYADFLEARRHLIALKINEYMDSLITEPVIVHEKPIAELIKLGESATLEFKSTLQWDVVQGAENRLLRRQVLKTIAAFLNSPGGTLVIGVEDDGNILGLARDVKITGNSVDKFAVLLTSLISEHIGADYSSLIKIRFENIAESTVCVVDVSQSSIPAYLKLEKGEEFYVRFGPTSRLLGLEETVNYIQQHWNG